jgi:D-alanyl-lipoteichoic acid acyltransferase DltB (MBOAT superfamily)
MQTYNAIYTRLYNKISLKKTTFVKDETMVYEHCDEWSISFMFHCFQWCLYVHSRPKIHSTLIDKNEGAFLNGQTREHWTQDTEVTYPPKKKKPPQHITES